jgi:pimeloyl-ACP methyl ester carboxylesterase
MQNVFDTFSQAAILLNGFFSANSSDTMASLASTSSFGSLRTAGIANAAFSYSAGGKAVCVTGLVDVPVVANTTVVTYPGPTNNFELTEFITNFARKDTTAFATYIGGTSQVSDTFSIFSKLCVPNDATKASKLTSVQFLTHGGTTDYNYWDFAAGYSYVDAAAEKGYATFSYDRLGTGNSEHPDPKQVVQTPLQIDLAHVLIQKIKAATIGGIKFTNVVGIGHSLGSAVTQGVAAKYPSDFNALALTGHSQGSEGGTIGFAAAAQQIANTLPDRPELKTLPNGYFSLGPIPQTLQFAFFYYPYFNNTRTLLHIRCQEAANCSSVFTQEFNTRQTNAIGETLTLGGLYTPATAYTKPVQILNGIQDYFYCQGNCLAGGDDATLDALNVLFPNREKNKSEAVNIEDCGHNINLHFKRTEAFGRILTFIANAGIKP